MSSPTYFFEVRCGEFFSNYPRCLINRCSPKAAASSLFFYRQAVQAIFDPKKIDLMDLLRWFWEAWLYRTKCA